MGDVIAFDGPREGPRLNVMIFQHKGEWGWKLVHLPAGKTYFGLGYATLAAARRGCWRAMEHNSGREPSPRTVEHGRGDTAS